MQISGSGPLPLHIARAYGMGGSVQARPAATAQATAAPLRVQPSDAYLKTSATAQLVAGHVSQSVHFDAHGVSTSGSANASPAHVFQMYTRAADKVEVAVAVQVGKMIDFTG